MENLLLIKACREGDKKAFRELVNKYSDFAFRLAFRILNTEDDARDMVQESFITVWEKLDTYKTEKKFENWLYRIIVNKCYDQLRKRKITTTKGSANWQYENYPENNNPERQMENKELGELILALTDKLSKKQKIVFVLSELEGLSQDDIAEATGLTKSSIKSNLHHARKNIKQKIQKHI